MKLIRKVKVLALISLVVSTMSFNVFAMDIKKIHFLIPGGAGGGWDSTARGVGEALIKSKIIKTASYENMSGGGGGKAIGYLIENAKSNYNTIMINSTPIIIRSLIGRFPYNFRDLTMIAGIIGDYSAFVVRKDSSIKSFNDLVIKFKENPRKIAIGGGSAPGSMDHLVAAQAMEAAQVDPRKVKYIAYDAGGKAMAALLSGEIQVLSTGFSEAVALVKAGEVRIIAMTGSKRNDTLANVPTLKEQGINMEFVNWRGFFAAPGLSEKKVNEYKTVLAKMYNTSEWESIRKRNGWINIHNSGKDFEAYLIKQETIMKNLMKKLGFL